MKPTSPLDKPELLEVARTARALLGKLKEALPAIDSAITIATVHHCPYGGPAFGEDVDALEAAFAALDRINP